MQGFTVVYLETFGGEPLAFVCQAEDEDHAEEQCADSQQGIDVVWVSEGCDAQQAIDNWWHAA
jgi:hypothetical protein